MILKNLKSTNVNQSSTLQSELLTNPKHLDEIYYVIFTYFIELKKFEIGFFFSSVSNS